ACEATRAIPAHLGLAAICVVVAHPEIRAVLRRLHGDQAVRTDATVPIAKPRNRGLVEAVAEIAVVEHDEVIPGSVHLGEVQCWHGFRDTRSPRDVKAEWDGQRSGTAVPAGGVGRPSRLSWSDGRLACPAYGQAGRPTHSDRRDAH